MSKKNNHNKGKKANSVTPQGIANKELDTAENQT